MKRIFFVVNTLEFFLSHRLPIAIALKKAGFDVHVATGSDKGASKVRAHGITHHDVSLSRKGQNPISEFKSLVTLYFLFKDKKPDVVHLVTIKPIIYGGIVCKLAKVPAVVAAVSGLGTVFLAKGFLAKLRLFFVSKLYRFALSHHNLKVIFQNCDDRQIFVSNKIVKEHKSILIRGSGVDLFDYNVRPEPKGIPTVVFAARLLKDKGIFEYVEAANLLRERNVEVLFKIFGCSDKGNSSSITEAQIEQWRDLPNIDIKGFSDNIAFEYGRANIVCLPSYREGIPKSLIEAAACGRAVVTTDVPGCRDAVVPSTSGLLVPPRDAVALANAIEFLIRSPDERERMGIEGRKMAETFFDIEFVVKNHLDIYYELLVG